MVCRPANAGLNCSDHVTVIVDASYGEARVEPPRRMQSPFSVVPLTPAAMPGSHAGRNDLSCLGCHQAAASGAAATPAAALDGAGATSATPSAGLSGAPAMAHAAAGYEACLSCHNALSNHDSRLTNELCGDCHRPQ